MSQSFLFSSVARMPTTFFSGLAFAENDMVMGPGYDQFLASTGSNFVGGEDGAYVAVREQGIGHRIGVDFSGYFKLFLYRSGRNWAVSNSIVRLVRHARDNGWAVTASDPHLAALAIQGSFGNQIATLQTGVEQITLVPSSCELRVVSNEVTIVQTRRHAEMSATKLSYAEALEVALRTWSQRFLTLLNGAVEIRSDLTGGRDSRAILSLFLASTEPKGLEKVRFSCSGHGSDRQIAGEIANAYGLSLNTNGESSSQPLCSETAFTRWEDLCLGIYTPVYFPVYERNSQAVALGGAGGESHRRFYPAIGLERFLDVRAKFFRSAENFEIFRNHVVRDIEFLSHGVDSGIDPLMVHYRHFRDRLHGGRTPQYGNTLAPLGGADFRLASSLCPENLRERSQVLADIMLNCDADLARMPFDNPKKTLDEEHIRNHTRVDLSNLKCGQVYGHRALLESSSVECEIKPLDILGERYYAARRALTDTSLFKSKYLAKADELMADAMKNRRFAHAIDGSRANHIIFAHEIMA